MSKFKAKLEFVTGLKCDASPIKIESNCHDMVENDIYDCGVYDWIAYNLGIEIPQCSFICVEVDVFPSYWGSDIDEIDYSIVDGSIKTSEITKLQAENQQLKADKAELVGLLGSIHKDLLERADMDSDGFKVVNLGNTNWSRIKDELEKTK